MNRYLIPFRYAFVQLSILKVMAIICVLLMPAWEKIVLIENSSSNNNDRGFNDEEADDNTSGLEYEPPPEIS